MRPNFNLKFAEFYIYWSVNNARNPKKNTNVQSNANSLLSKGRLNLYIA